MLVDVKTGKRIAHVAEIDKNAADAGRRALILRPHRPIPFGTEVGVALLRNLQDTGGQPYARTPAMERILGGLTTGHVRIDLQQHRWTALFNALAKAGVPKEDVLAAWPYRVASAQWVTGPAQAAKLAIDAAHGKTTGNRYVIEEIEVAAAYKPQFASVPAAGPALKVTVGAMHPDIALRLRGRFKMPLVLDGTGSAAMLPAGGKITVQQTVERPFVVLVPPSVLAAEGPAPVVVYGHGFLRGACVEGCVTVHEAEYMPRMGNALGAVVVGTDWWGLSSGEIGVAATVALDFNGLRRITDKLVQAVQQPRILADVARADLAKDAMLQRAGKAGPEPLIDASRAPVYCGNSLGGILGTTAVALGGFSRAVLNVPGSTWSTMLNRSSNFAEFSQIVASAYPDPFERQVLYALSQSMWDLSDPIHFASAAVTSTQHALWAVALHDSQVPNLASAALQRAAGVPVLTPAPGPWWQDGPQAPSLGFVGPHAFVVWDTKRGAHPYGNALPYPDNGAHLATRWMPEFQQMIWRVLLGDGRIEQRYCLAGGRDGDDKLPCDIVQAIPKAASEVPALPVIPPPAVP
ncbi:MAG: hypothetical protein EXR79_16555 [Myxococcales bacterium]|nr:hypothetical protein [Myxococcales bacterium]